jgi:hypothetical protein
LSQQPEARSKDEGPLAVICGGGRLPPAVAEAAVKAGRDVLLFPIRGWADPAAIGAYRQHWVGFGDFGSFCRVARAEGCRDVVFIGSVVRPGILQLRPDFKTLRLLPRIARMFRGGDDHLLRGLASMFEEQGFRLIGAHEVAPGILMPEGPLGTLLPKSCHQADIDKGLALLDAISPFDIGQAVVVENGRILAMEATEGTDAMLMRVAQLRANGQIAGASGHGVLVKAPKRDQSRSFDLPSIGPKTIESVALARLGGLAVAAGSSIVAEPERIGMAADRKNLFVVGVKGNPTQS